MALAGIDVSVFQGDVSAKLPSCAFAISQATVGMWVDPHNAEHLAEFKKFSLLVPQSYHYAVYGPGDGRQAELYLQHSEGFDILAVDAEARGSNGILYHPDVIIGIIENIKKLDPHKRNVLLYSSRETLVTNNRGQSVSIWKYVSVQDGNWVADYSGRPDRSGIYDPVKWMYWQRSGQGIDLDTYYGSQAQLDHFAGRYPH